MVVKTCVFIANDAGKYAFEKMLNKGWIDAIITIDKTKAEKLKVTNYFDIHNYNLSSIKVYKAKKYNLKSEEDIYNIKLLDCDIGFVLGWNRLIPKDILETFSIGVYGFHGTPFGLPVGRGRSPTIWTIALGYDKFYLHLFRVAEGVDDGNIIDTQLIKIYSTDDIKLFHMKTSYWAWRMIERSYNKIINGFKGIPQKGTPVYFRKRTEKDGKIRWNLSAEMIYNLVRAVTKPYPGAWTIYKGEKIRIWKVRIFDDENCSEVPGTICEVFDRTIPLVSTGKGSIVIEEYEPYVKLEEGKRFE